MWERVKDLMDLPGGAKFSPSYIESRLRFSPYIKEVISIGGKDRPFVTAIVDMNFENVSRWAEVHRIPYTTFVDLSQKSEVHELVRNDIQRVNRDLPDSVKVKRFVNLHKELDADEAEMTRTRKLRRSYMEDRYRDLISALYGDREDMEIETEVKYRDGRMGTVKTAIKIKNVED